MLQFDVKAFTWIQQQFPCSGLLIMSSLIQLQEEFTVSEWIEGPKLHIKFHLTQEFCWCLKVAMMFLKKEFFRLRSLFWVHIIFFIFNSASLLSNLCLKLSDNLIHLKTIQERIKGLLASIQLFLASVKNLFTLTTKGGGANFSFQKLTTGLR